MPASGAISGRIRGHGPLLRNLMAVNLMLGIYLLP